MFVDSVLLHVYTHTYVWMVLKYMLEIIQAIECYFRLARLWTEELANKGLKKASFMSVAARAVLTRIILSSILTLMSNMCTYCTAVSYLNHPFVLALQI